MHLDIAAPASQPGDHPDQVDAYVERLVRKGARVVFVTQDGSHFVVIKDPEGREFCVD